MRVHQVLAGAGRVDAVTGQARMYRRLLGAAAHDAPGSGQLDRVARFAVADVAGGEGLVDMRGEWSVG